MSMSSNVECQPGSKKKTRWSIRSCSPYSMIVCLCFASTMVTPFVLNGCFFHPRLTGRPGWLVIDRGKTEFQAFHGIPTSKKMQMAGGNCGRSAGIGIWWGYHEIYPARSCNTLKTGKHIRSNHHICDRSSLSHHIEIAEFSVAKDEDRTCPEQMEGCRSWCSFLVATSVATGHIQNNQCS